MKLSVLTVSSLSLIMILATNAQNPGKTIYLNDSINIELIHIPRGSFMMGSPEEEKGRGGDEGPVHKVDIQNSYYMAKYEVTQKLWMAVMEDNPAVFKLSPHHPVESVSWNDCQEFIARLNELTHEGKFRLPTEAEWEYACRAGTKTAYYWGDFMAENGWSEYAWANSRSLAITHPVGQKKHNPWGLYDMSGNVWEWCSDNYTSYPDPNKEKSNDSSKESEKSITTIEKVFRGGSWFDFYESHRCANRHRHGVEKGYTAIGMRLVWEEE